jgi:ubiquinone biosynthesis protein UbiJ
MLHALQGLVGTAALERATLLLNHVVAAEPAAVARLRPFAGRCIQLQFDGWPGWLPAWPPTAFRITPAGLFEWCGDMPPSQSDLRISIDASNPALAFAQALAGERPRVDVAGDSALAGEIDWLFDNLRWDVEDDLGRVVGAAPAREIARLGRAVAAGVRSAARRFGPMPARGAPAEPASR